MNLKKFTIKDCFFLIVVILVFIYGLIIYANPYPMIARVGIIILVLDLLLVKYVESPREKAIFSFIGGLLLAGLIVLLQTVIFSPPLQQHLIRGIIATIFGIGVLIYLVYSGLKFWRQSR